jgi:hypothetical protein
MKDAGSRVGKVLSGTKCLLAFWTIQFQGERMSVNRGAGGIEVVGIRCSC